MIRIETNTKDITQFVERIKGAVLNSKADITTDLTNFGHEAVQYFAPAWRGTLKGHVIRRIFPKTGRGIIMMDSPEYNTIALDNEMNWTGEKLKPKVGLLKQWADDKGIFQDKNYIVTGGKGTRFGKQNKFFSPGFQYLVKNSDQVIERSITKNIARVI